MRPKPLLHTARELDEPFSLPYERAVQALREGRIDVEHGLMRWGSNYTFLVSVEHEAVQFLAIYKPRVGERPLWDFPDGTLCQRETAAYVLSELLEWYIVPPTVLRDGPRGEGSLQIFINHDPNRHYFTFDDEQDSQVQRMAVFDTLANNADRKGGHCLLDEDERLWGIDHGLTFHFMNKLRTVIWKYSGEPIPEPLLEDLQALCQRLDRPDNPLRKQLDALLAAREMQALRSRLDTLLHTRLYPEPGPGPNRPWPAV